MPKFDAVSAGEVKGVIEACGWKAEMSTSTQVRKAYRGQGLSNLLRMGHCAPAIAQTLLDVTNAEGEWLVKLAAGMPGGIGKSGGECGGITSPLLMLGLRHGLETEQGLPVILEKGHAYCQRFLECNGSMLCKNILGKRRLPLPCIKVTRFASELLAETIIDDTTRAIPSEEREALRRLYSYQEKRGFHCAQSVFHKMGDTLPVTQELLDATSGFMGGTLFKGMTCSALTAGVMAIGLKAGEIENSRPRVMRMLLTMAWRGDAFNDKLNKFNKSMNRGRSLVNWFASEFGSTQCRDITGCSFSSMADVEKYIQCGHIERCELIAERIAKEAAGVLARLQMH